MISDSLLPAIKERFPDLPFTFAEPPKPIASLKSPCEALGTVDICDDGDEITIYLGTATHSHFSCYEETLTEQAKEQQITSDVLEFLDKLLTDRVVVWCVAGGVAGGWRVLRAEENPPDPSMLKRQFLWSREIR